MKLTIKLDQADVKGIFGEHKGVSLVFTLKLISLTMKWNS